MTTDAPEQRASSDLDREPAPAEARRRLRSRPGALGLAAAAGAVVVAGVATVVAILGSAASTDADRDGTATALAARRDLVQRSTVSGTLGYGDERRVVNYSPGTITSLPQEGRVLRPGAVLYRVNEQPVVLFSGSRPAWRPLGVGVTDGLDVRQLEENLRALGYDRERGMTIDEHFSASTTAAVGRWQKDVGLVETGRVEFGNIVFLSGRRRVGRVAALIGDPARRGAEVMTTSSTERLVTAEIDTGDQGDIAVGGKVLIDLLNGTATTGTIKKVGKVASVAAQQGGGGQAGSAPTTSTITFEVRPDRLAVVGRLDKAPVEVGVASEQAKNALSVPVSALLALRGGRYGVEIVRDGTTIVVPVTPGLYSDGGYVELRRGRVKPGDLVVVPA
jgi:peptidoglycan hydrolase-like protein with peptidoglycan-binding domain